MRIVHFSTTRLAGAPIRLVRALQAHTEHDVRLVDLDRFGQFEHDLVFRESLEEAVELARAADVIHLHNYLDLASREFAPIDFGELSRRGAVVVRQFHSSPDTVAARMGGDLSRVLDCPLPALVVPHNAERYYPRARVVPNVLPQDDPRYRPTGLPGEGIAFTPSEVGGAWEHRWNTKGLPEMRELLGRVSRRTGRAARIVTGRPLAEVLAVKRGALVVIDDLVTGSYHLSGLEGLCAGRAVAAFLDARIERVLLGLTGAESVPFVNMRLEEAEEPLVALVSEPEATAAAGVEARRWIERHWRAEELARHFLEAYEDPGSIRRQPELAVDHERDVAALDRAWEKRRRQALAARPLRVRAGAGALGAYHRLPLPLRRSVRRLLGRPLQ